MVDMHCMLVIQGYVSYTLSYVIQSMHDVFCIFVMRAMYLIAVYLLCTACLSYGGTQ